MIGRTAAQADRTAVAGKNDVIVNQLILQTGIKSSPLSLMIASRERWGRSSMALSQLTKQASRKQRKINASSVLSI
jgi:hypothetical protein